MNDVYAERVAAVRERFMAKLDARISDIELAMPASGGEVALETLVEAHRQAHGLCGVGPTLGYVETGKAARSVEQVLLGAVKAKRGLTDDEITSARSRLTVLRATAAIEVFGRPG